MCGWRREKDHTIHTTVACKLIPPTQQKWQVQKQPQRYFFQSCTCYIENLSVEVKSQQGLPQKTNTVLLVFKAEERRRTGHYTALAKHMPLAERGAGKQAQHSTCWGLQTWRYFLCQNHILHRAKLVPTAAPPLAADHQRWTWTAALSEIHHGWKAGRESNLLVASGRPKSVAQLS